MKRALVLVLLVVAMVFGSVAIAEARTAEEWETLVTGRYLTECGRVESWREGDTLYVNFVAFDDWMIRESAVAVGLSIADIPQSKGGPRPGHFPSKTYWDPMTKEALHVIQLPAGYPESFLIAAHAVIVNPAGCDETAWGTNCLLDAWMFPGSNWARFIVRGDEKPQL